MSSPTAIDIFLERCGAKATLAAHGQVELADAVDAMQAAAVASGLVDELGQDAVQQILAHAFAGAR